MELGIRQASWKVKGDLTPIFGEYLQRDWTVSVPLDQKLSLAEYMMPYALRGEVNLEIKCTVEILEHTTGALDIVCINGSNASTCYGMYITAANNVRFMFGTYYQSPSAYDFTTKKKLRFVTYPRTSDIYNECFVDDVRIGTKTYANKTLAVPTTYNELMTRANSTAVQTGKVRLYDMQIYHSERLVCDFMPVQVGNKFGVYNKVDGKYILTPSEAFSVGGEKAYKTKLEYIESTGTQAIFTDVITQNYHVIMSFQKTYNGEYDSVAFGGYDGVLCWSSDGKTLKGYDNYKFGSFIPEIGKKYEFFSSGSPSNSMVFSSESGEIYSNVMIASYDNITGIFLCAGSDTYNPQTINPYGFTACRIYGFTAYDSSDPTKEIRKLIPVVDNSNVVCMYDEISGKCFYNCGTGDFIAGPEI